MSDRTGTDRVRTYPPLFHQLLWSLASAISGVSVCACTAALYIWNCTKPIFCISRSFGPTDLSFSQCLSLPGRDASCKTACWCVGGGMGRPKRRQGRWSWQNNAHAHKKRKPNSPQRCVHGHWKGLGARAAWQVVRGHNSVSLNGPSFVDQPTSP